MNSLEPLRIQQVNLNNISYTKVKNKKNDNKKIVYIKCDGKPLVFQCPPLLNENLPKKITSEYYEMEVPLITQENSKQDKLVEFINSLDKKIREDAIRNAKIWFDENEKTYTLKTLVKESEKYPYGLLKIKIIKTPTFETMLLLDNKKKINIRDVPQNSWVKMLLEIYSVVINTESKSFYLFLRPIALSFKEKESIKYNYKFLEESSSTEDDVPDSDVNNIFMKQNVSHSDKNDTSSQINVKNLNILQVEASNNFSSESTSSENRKLSTSQDEELSPSENKKLDENSEEEDEHFNKLERLSDSESESDIKDNNRALVLSENNFEFEEKVKLTSSSSSDSELKKLDSSSDEETTKLSSKLNAYKL